MKVCLVTPSVNFSNIIFKQQTDLFRIHLLPILLLEEVIDRHNCQLTVKLDQGKSSLFLPLSLECSPTVGAIFEDKALESKVLLKTICMYM